MLVRFISHAAISIEESGYNILIDPWFLDSTQEHHLIKSIGGGFDTIDFQIPQTTEKISQYTPDAIFVSHFHPHHSPMRDINILCQNAIANKKEIIIGYPTPNEQMENALSERIPKGVIKKPMAHGVSITVGPFTIESKQHTVPFHNAWYIRSQKGSVLHLADGAINKDIFNRKVDNAWMALEKIKPDILFISSGGHSARETNKDGTRTIREAGIFTAVEAAKVTRIIEPKAVALIGCYNHSIWKNRHEYIRQASQVLEEFDWAISYLNSDIKHLYIKPGNIFAINEPSYIKKCSAYFEN